MALVHWLTYGIVWTGLTLVLSWLFYEQLGRRVFPAMAPFDQTLTGALLVIAVFHIGRIALALWRASKRASRI